MPTLSKITFSLGRGAALATVVGLAIGAGEVRAQSGVSDAIAAGELPVQCEGDAALTDHLATLRRELVKARERLGRRKVYFERVQAMNLDRLTFELTTLSGDARTARQLDTPSAAGDVGFQDTLKETEAELDLLMEAATAAAIGDRLSPARSSYTGHIHAAAEETKAFETAYLSSLKNCRDRNGASVLAASDGGGVANPALAQNGVNPWNDNSGSWTVLPSSIPPAIAVAPPVTPARSPYDAEEAPLSGELQMTPMSEADTQAMAGMASGGRQGVASLARLDLEAFSGRYTDGVHIFEVMGRENVLTFIGSRPGAGLSINGLNCTAQGSGAVCQGDGYSKDDDRRIAFGGRLSALRQGGAITLSVTLNAISVVSGKAQPSDSAYRSGSVLSFTMRPY